MVVVRVWVDGDPDKDQPFLEVLGDTELVKPVVARAEAGKEDVAVLNGVCMVAGDALAGYARDAIVASEKDVRLADLQVQEAVLQKLTPVVVDSVLVDALKPASSAAADAVITSL